MLNIDQERALADISRWYKGNQRFYIIDGPGGTGKSFLADSILKTLPRISPILIAPTNEALKQLRNKISGDYSFRTYHSALGIAPSFSDNELKFETPRIPKFWDDINLVLADEGSMMSEWLLNLFIDLNVRIIFLGHKAQLPPVEKKRSIFDPCISPVFEKNYPSSHLRIPMRNTGKLWDFNCTLEQNIYTMNKTIPRDFDIKKKDLKEFLSGEGKERIFSGDTKIVSWSNESVDTWNDSFREIYYGAQARKDKYLPGDKIILVKPLTFLNDLELFDENILKNIQNSPNLQTFYSNSLAEVLAVQPVTVRIVKSIPLRCLKITVKCEGITGSFYEPVSEEEFRAFGLYYEHKAWGLSSKEAKNKAFKFKYFILSCFASLKHFYAATAHRLQGSSVPSVIVDNSDISRNPCWVEQAKCRYVATSRAVDNLMFYRG